MKQINGEARIGSIGRTNPGSVGLASRAIYISWNQNYGDHIVFHLPIFRIFSEKNGSGVGTMMTPLATKFIPTHQFDFLWTDLPSRVQFLHYLSQIIDFPDQFPKVAQHTARLIFDCFPADTTSALIHADSIGGYFSHVMVPTQGGIALLGETGARFGQRVVLELEKIFRDQLIPVSVFELIPHRCQVSLRTAIPTHPVRSRRIQWRNSQAVQDIARLIFQAIAGTRYVPDGNPRIFIPGLSNSICGNHCSPVKRAIVNIWAKGTDKYEDFIWKWEDRLRLTLKLLTQMKYSVGIVLPEEHCLVTKDRVRWNRFRDSLSKSMPPRFEWIPVDGDLPQRLMNSTLILTHDTGLAHLADLLGKRPIVMYGRGSKKRWIRGFRNRLLLAPQLTMDGFILKLRQHIAELNLRSAKGGTSDT